MDGFPHLPAWLNLPSPSGFETRLAEAIASWWEEEGLPVQRDPLGNLWVSKGPEKAPMTWLVAAPLDEPGLIVTHVDAETGLARVVPLHPEMAPMGRVPSQVRTLEGRRGILRWTSHLPQQAHPLWEHVYLEMWGSPPTKGDILVWDTPVAWEPEEMPTHLVGRGLHRALAVLLASMVREVNFHRVRVHILLAVREGVSTRGAVVAASTLSPQAILYLKTVPAQEPQGPPDLPQMGRGPVLLLREPGWIADSRIVNFLQAHAPKTYQKAVLHQGERTIHNLPFATPGGVATGILALACRGWQTPQESLAYEDWTALTTWLVRVLQVLDDTPELLSGP